MELNPQNVENTSENDEAVVEEVEFFDAPEKRPANSRCQ